MRGWTDKHWSLNESMERQTIKIKTYRQQKKEKQNEKTLKVKKLNEEENESMADHQKHLRAERWTSVWEAQVYIPPEERQQPKSWEQTNKRRGKENKKIKLNNKELLHHSPFNFGSREALMHCFTALN